MWFCDFAKKTQRSIRYAFGDIKDILPILKERNQKYFAVSDYGDISIWPSQYFKCKENDIVPILGIETFINNYRITGQDGQIIVHKISYEEEWNKSIKDMNDIEKDLVTMDFSIDLFAFTLDGYYNIIQIHNDAQINGMYKRPRTTDKFISTHGKGVLALLPNPYNDVCSLVYNGLYNEAKRRYEFYKQTFDRVIVSIPILEDKSCQEINDIMIKFCLENDIEMMPVINSHYNFKDDEEVFKTFRKISKIRGGMTFDVDLCEGMTYKTKEEVIETYRKFHKNEIFTEEVLDKLFKTYETVLQNFKVLDIDVTPKMPKFPDGDKILRRKAWEGLVKKGLDKKRNYVDRLEYELDNVIKANFQDYFLFLKDLRDWYVSKDRFFSSGRGSGAGSLVLYCLGIMNVDPIKYNLLFERFLDASRLQAIIEKGEKVTAEQYPDVDCFTLDTLVLTPDGPKEIGDLHIGDEVITRENEIKKITNEVVHKNCPIVRVCYGSWYLDTTYNHKFLIKRNDEFYYEYVMNLREDDFLVESDDVLIPIIAIIDKSNVLKLVKDIEIEEEHCFRVCGKAFNKVELKNGQIMFLSDDELNL